MSVLLALLVGQLASATASQSCESGSSAPGQALLQSHRMAPLKLVAQTSEVGEEKRTMSAITTHRDKSMSAITTHRDAINKAMSAMSQPTGINPSGAAATLDQTGYVAVADRCCQSEMIEFIQRQIFVLGMEVCFEPGLRGIVPYHSCEYGLQSFDKLTADLLRDSVDRCGWLRNSGQCQPIPADCPEFTEIIPFYDCGCNRTTASVLDISTASVVSNNLGGKGPVNTDPEEIRYSSGTSHKGEPFDLVITALTPYTAGNIKNNGKDGGFGRITMKYASEAHFKFSFVEPGTNTPVIQDEVHMSTYDLDGGNGGAGGLEYVSSVGYTGYVTDPNPNLLATLFTDTHELRTKFTSIGRSWDNPSDPDTLTADQRRNAVMFFYKNVSSFEVNFGIEGGTSGRTLFFSFLSALNDRCGH